MSVRGDSRAKRISLVIPAAGRGTRFGGAIPKQLLPLKGRAVLLRSLDAFAGQIDEAVLAISEDAREEIAALIAGAGLPFPVRLVAGGATRQESVHAGILASDPACELVLVHDAVRPLVPPQCIATCIAALTTNVAAVVAIPCTATVKRARADRTVEATVPRDDLWLAQTPQGLRRAEAITAFGLAASDGRACSDDVQVMEHAGHRVALVMGDARNIKLTTPDDWAVAEALLG